MHGPALREALAGAEGVFAAVATAGTTNAGLLDDLAGAAEACREHGVWLHVDGAYGAAGLCAPSVRARYAGIEHADSLIVDPHKWLFAPFDSCALLYRDPALDRGRVGLGAVDGEREPERDAARAAGQVHPVVGRVVGLLVAVERVLPRRALAVRGAAERRLAVQKRARVERREQPLVRVDDQRVRVLDPRVALADARRA